MRLPARAERFVNNLNDKKLVKHPTYPNRKDEKESRQTRSKSGIFKRKQRFSSGSDSEDGNGSLAAKRLRLDRNKENKETKGRRVEDKVRMNQELGRNKKIAKSNISQRSHRLPLLLIKKVTPPGSKSESRRSSERGQTRSSRQVSEAENLVLSKSLKRKSRNSINALLDAQLFTPDIPTYKPQKKPDSPVNDSSDEDDILCKTWVTKTESKPKDPLPARKTRSGMFKIKTDGSDDEDEAPLRRRIPPKTKPVASLDYETLLESNQNDRRKSNWETCSSMSTRSRSGTLKRKSYAYGDEKEKPAISSSMSEIGERSTRSRSGVLRRKSYLNEGDKGYENTTKPHFKDANEMPKKDARKVNAPAEKEVAKPPTKEAAKAQVKELAKPPVNEIAKPKEVVKPHLKEVVQSPMEVVTPPPVKELDKHLVKEVAKNPLDKTSKSPVKERAKVPVKETDKPRLKEVSRPRIKDADETPVKELVTSCVNEVTKSPLIEAAKSPVNEVAKSPVQEEVLPHRANNVRYSNSMADAVQVKCNLCGQPVYMTRMRSHTKSVHKMNIADYKSKFGNLRDVIIERVFHECGLCHKDVLLDSDEIATHLKRFHQVTHKNYNEQFMRTKVNANSETKQSIVGQTETKTTPLLDLCKTKTGTKPVSGLSKPEAKTEPLSDDSKSETKTKQQLSCASKPEPKTNPLSDLKTKTIPQAEHRISETKENALSALDQVKPNPVKHRFQPNATKQGDVSEKPTYNPEQSTKKDDETKQSVPEVEHRSNKSLHGVQDRQHKATTKQVEREKAANSESGMPKIRQLEESNKTTALNKNKSMQKLVDASHKSATEPLVSEAVVVGNLFNSTSLKVEHKAHISTSKLVSAPMERTSKQNMNSSSSFNTKVTEEVVFVTEVKGMSQEERDELKAIEESFDGDEIFDSDEDSSDEE